MRFIWIIPVLISLAACVNERNYGQEQNDLAREPLVELVQLNHMVSFAPNQAALTAQARQELEQFLQRSLVSVPEGVAGVGNAELTLSHGRPDALVSLERETVLLAYLSGHPQAKRLPTYRAGSPTGARPGQPAAEGVMLTVSRYVVVPPNCPDWSKPNTFDYKNTSQPNWACADQHNLALMVANPRDLVRGRAPDGQDGMRAAIGVERYRIDDETPLASGGFGDAINVSTPEQ